MLNVFWAKSGRRRLALAVSFTLFALLASPARSGPDAKAKKIITIEGITEYRLDNGVRFLIFPDPAASKVTINMTVLVGSRHEGYGETGMAHLLEHMLFKGAKEFPEADKALQEHGAVEANATTWVDRTNYYETMPGTDKNLEFGIRFEADRLVNSFIRREDLAKEMTVVRNEFEQGENSPPAILSQRMMAVAYEWHNYGKNTIGNRADIERVPIDRLHAFYKKHYQPDNIVLAVAGKFDEQKAMDLIVKHFGALPRPKRVLDQTYTEEPAQDGERVVTLRRVGKVAMAGVIYHVPAGSHEDFPAVQVLEDLLTRAPSGRLYKALVESRKATEVFGSALAWHDPGAFEIMAQVNEGVKPEEVRDVILDELEKFKPATEAEVDRSRKRLKARRNRALGDSQRITIELSEWIGAGDWRLLFLHRDRVAKVTPADVDRVAKKYLVQNNRTAGLFIPSMKASRAEIPVAPAVAELLKDYKGGPPLAKGEPFELTPSNIEKRTKRSELAGGIKVALLPKKTRAEIVKGALTLHFGNEKSLKDHVMACEFIGPLLLYGTKKLTREEIQERLDELEARLSIGSGVGSVSLSFEAKRQTLPELLDLVREVLREPVFPEKEFAVLQGQELQSLQESALDPDALAARAMTRKLHPYPKDNVRYHPTFAESIQRVQKTTRDQVAKLYADQVGGTRGELAVVGDFDSDVALKKLEAIFDNWKSTVPYQRIEEPADTKVAGGRETILTPDKESATYYAGHCFALKDSDPDYVPLLMGNYLVGGSYTSRLWDRLRQKEGLSYSVGSSLSVSARDLYGLFYVAANCNPLEMEKADKAAIEELKRAIAKGVTEEEVSVGIKEYLQKLKVGYSSDGGLARDLRGGLELGRTFAYYTDLEKKLAALTVADVNRALRRHLNPDRLVIIRAGDFKKDK